MILRIPHCSRKVEGCARFRCFYFLKINHRKKVQRAENIYRCLGDYYQHLASELAALSQSDFRSHEYLIQFLQER